MKNDNNNKQDSLHDEFDRIFDESSEEVENERRQLLSSISVSNDIRAVHVDFTHKTIPAFLCDNNNYDLLIKAVLNNKVQPLVKTLYESISHGYPESIDFTGDDIKCHSNIIKFIHEIEKNIRMVILEMPTAIAAGESLFTCVCLTHEQDNLNNVKWRYFILDASVDDNNLPQSFVYEYLQNESTKPCGGFYLTGLCWPDAEAFIEKITYEWDDRSYIL